MQLPPSIQKCVVGKKYSIETGNGYIFIHTRRSLASPLPTPSATPTTASPLCVKSNLLTKYHFMVDNVVVDYNRVSKIVGWDWEMGERGRGTFC